jgi:AraC family transcriptional regulator, regulatory protein of adaptative response / DNA-3-methyladenine glycosylase II
VILRAVEPFEGRALLDFFAARAVPGVEEVVEGAYRRSLRVSGGPLVVELRPVPGGIEVDSDDPEVVAQLAALLDLDADAPAIAAHFGDELGSVAGTRVPGAVDGYEIAVRAVLGQQISIQAAATHAGGLVQVAGERVACPRGAVTHLFPTVEAIARAPDSAFAMPTRRRDTLRSLAGAPLDDLISLPGIGPWTQTYVNMRALRDRDAWLPTDLGVKHALERLGHDGDAERWRPYRAYAVVHLWRMLAHLPHASQSA